jgi:hypothetical protein
MTQEKINTPIVGSKYLWKDYGFLVTVTDMKEKILPAKEYQDGSLYGGGSEYSIEMEYTDKKGITCKHWTPFTKFSFELNS